MKEDMLSVGAFNHEWKEQLNYNCVWQICVGLYFKDMFQAFYILQLERETWEEKERKTCRKWPRPESNLGPLLRPKPAAFHRRKTPPQAKYLKTGLISLYNVKVMLSVAETHNCVTIF